MESDSASDHEDSKQRGPTTKTKANKVKLVITYNKKGVPVGKEATKLSTFEGLVARTMVPITYDSWLEVGEEVREGLWQYVLVSLCFLPVITFVQICFCPCSDLFLNQPFFYVSGKVCS